MNRCWYKLEDNQLISAFKSIYRTIAVIIAFAKFSQYHGQHSLKLITNPMNWETQKPASHHPHSRHIQNTATEIEYAFTAINTQCIQRILELALPHVELLTRRLPLSLHCLQHTANLLPLLSYSPLRHLHCHHQNLSMPASASVITPLGKLDKVHRLHLRRCKESLHLPHTRQPRRELLNSHHDARYLGC